MCGELYRVICNLFVFGVVFFIRFFFRVLVSSIIFRIFSTISFFNFLFFSFMRFRLIIGKEYVLFLIILCVRELKVYCCINIIGIILMLRLRFSK